MFGLLTFTLTCGLNVIACIAITDQGVGCIGDQQQKLVSRRHVLEWYLVQGYRFVAMRFIVAVAGHGKHRDADFLIARINIGAGRICMRAQGDHDFRLQVRNFCGNLGDLLRR